MEQKKLSVILFFTSFTVFSQVSKILPIDSLINTIEVSNGVEKLKSIVRLCENHSRSNPKKIKHYANIGLNLADELNHSHSKIILLRSIGVAQYTLGEMETSFSSLTKATQWSITTKDSLNLGRCYHQLGLYFYRLGNFDKEREYHIKAIGVAERSNDSMTIYFAKKTIANGYQESGNYTKSLKSYDELMQICAKHNLACIGAMVGKARALHNIGKPSEALELFFVARKKSLDIGDQHSVAVIEHHIGYVLKLTGLHEEALEYYTSVFTYFTQNEDVEQLSVVNENIGELKLSLDKDKEAEVFLKNALALKQDRRIPTVGVVLNDLGLVYVKRKQFDQAFDYFNMALLTFEKGQNEKGIGSVYNYLSQAYLETGDYIKAEQYALKALAINKNLQLHRETALSLENLTKTYEALDKFDLALQTKNELEVIDEFLKSSNELLAITKKLVVESLKENDVVIESTLVNEKEESKVSNSQMVWVLSFFILAVIGAGYYVVRIKKPPATNEKKIEYLQKSEANQLLKRLQDVIDTQKPYLNEDLTLKELASEINTTDKKLSTLLNRHLNTNFYDYINSLRIKVFKNKLASDTENHYSIIGVAHDCGFKSKSSFYRAFKKETGVSPVEYKKKLTI